METLSRRAREILDRARADEALPRATRMRVFHELERKIALGAQPVSELPALPNPPAPSQSGSLSSPMWIRFAVGAAAAAGAVMMLRSPTAPTRPAAEAVVQPAPAAASSSATAQQQSAPLRVAAPEPAVVTHAPAPVTRSPAALPRSGSARPPATLPAPAAPRPSIQPPPAVARTAEPAPEPAPAAPAPAPSNEPFAAPAPEAEEIERALAAEALASVLEPPPAVVPPPIGAVPPAVRPIDKRAPKPPQATALDEELKLLAAAQSALRDGMPERALAQLAEHAWRFPQGQLAESRDVARILALCRAGNQALARAESDRFLRRHPSSPYARRVTTICR